MKYRYIYEKWGEIRGKDAITKEDLANVKSRNYDFLIDLEEMKFFDADDNDWKTIEGDK